MTVWTDLYQQHRGMRSVSRDPFREWLIQSPPDASDRREPLLHLTSLDPAHLTLLALVSRRDDHLHQFTAMIEGTTPDKRPWAAAVHLDEDHATDDEDRKGSGACGHAAFHCHVGPTLGHIPQVRVPLPAVGPVGALDWLLSIVVPGWEPAPWPGVVAALPKKRSA